jgi:DNA-binding NarL/FixJ family response regulator
MGKVTRVLIADDHQTERRGIAGRLSSVDDIEVVGQVEQIELVLDEIHRSQPDVVLMDLKWEEDEGAGARVIAQVKQIYPEIKVVAISVYDQLIPEALQAGADAALVKGFSGEDLLKAI